MNKLTASILKGILIEQVMARFTWVSKINKYHEEWREWGETIIWCQSERSLLMDLILHLRGP